MQYVNDLCRRSEYLRTDSFVSLRELPLAKIISQISQESNASEAALSKSDCKSNTFLLHHQTFYKLFFEEKEKFIANRLNKKLFKEQIIFEFFQILIGEVANLAKIVYTL